MASTTLSVAHAGVRNLAALDAAFSDRGMKEFYRGFGDARRYAALRQSGCDWVASPVDGSEEIIVRPVNSDYTDGLRAGGCAVSDPRSGLKRAA